MLKIQAHPFHIHVRESCGLSFKSQLIEIEAPDNSARLLWLQDRITGRYYPYQRSRQNPSRGFLRLEISPFEELNLALVPDGPTNEVEELEVGPQSLANENIQLQLAPDCDGPLEAMDVAGPIVSVALRGQQARGKTFFDARSRVLKARGQWLEEGPLRAVWCYRVEFENGGFYAATVSLDAGDNFAIVDEELGAESGAQLVWDFTGKDWPNELFLLDPTPGGTFRRLHPHFDARHARLAAWTQYQQLHDFSDGFALLFENDFLGVVTLEGGSWRGNRLNHIEAWTRRYWHDNRRTRRGEPWDVKADSMPAPDAIPARGQALGVPHFCLESWIGAENGQSGHRRFALVAAPHQQLFPGAQNGWRGDGTSSWHFEQTSDRERYEREQSLLRQIHIQRGMLTLQDLAFKTCDWPAEAPPQEGAFTYSHPLLSHHLRHHEDEEERRIAQLKEYLASRVYGFWEGGGASHSNCVVGRVISPEMFHFEFLVRNERLAEDEKRLLRAHFAFLCHLFHSDNYYPGSATMEANGHCASFEPTIAGMANQNFFTDVMCVSATGAQIFSNHPEAPAWRERFSRLWRRQLEFHRYPQSGVWEESHTYFLHVLHTVVPVLLRQRDDGDERNGEGFQDPLFQSLCASIVGQLTPKHTYNSGFRHLLAWGDHEAGRHEHHVQIFKDLARAFVPHNAELARQLAWVSAECGGGEIEGIPSQPFEWKSGHIEGLGYCFRNESIHGEQSLLALRAGGAWGHHHHDDGSLQFFAHGEAFIVDAAFGHVQGEEMRKVLASGHSRWSLRDVEPFDYFWRFNRGWICAYETEGVFPFAVAWTPVYMVGRDYHTPSPLWPFVRHWRTVVQLAPEAFLIVDESDATIPQVVHFHLPGDVSSENGRVTAQNGAVQLHLVPLTAPISDEIALKVASAASDNKPEIPTIHLGVTDKPRREGNERFSTQDVIFQTGLLPRSVILVAASETLEARAENGVWHLSGDGWVTKVIFEAEAITLTNSHGQTRVLNAAVLRHEI